MRFRCCGDSEEMEPIIQQWINQDDIRNRIRYKVTYYNPYNNLALKTDEFNNIDDVALKLKITSSSAERMCKSSNIYGNIKIEKFIKNK